MVGAGISIAAFVGAKPAVRRGSIRPAYCPPLVCTNHWFTAADAETAQIRHIPLKLGSDAKSRPATTNRSTRYCASDSPAPLWCPVVFARSCRSASTVPSLSPQPDHGLPGPRLVRLALADSAGGRVACGSNPHLAVRCLMQWPKIGIILR
jgi:hypothetical protein